VCSLNTGANDGALRLITGSSISTPATWDDIAGDGGTENGFPAATADAKSLTDESSQKSNS
jgi:hypothetical protein